MRAKVCEANDDELMKACSGKMEALRSSGSSSPLPEALW